MIVPCSLEGSGGGVGVGRGGPPTLRGRRVSCSLDHIALYSCASRVCNISIFLNETNAVIRVQQTVHSRGTRAHFSSYGVQIEDQTK